MRTAWAEPWTSGVFDRRRSGGSCRPARRGIIRREASRMPVREGTHEVGRLRCSSASIQAGRIGKPSGKPFKESDQRSCWANPERRLGGPEMEAPVVAVPAPAGDHSDAEGGWFVPHGVSVDQALSGGVLPSWAEANLCGAFDRRRAASSADQLGAGRFRVPAHGCPSGRGPTKWGGCEMGCESRPSRTIASQAPKAGKARS